MSGQLGRARTATQTGFLSIGAGMLQNLLAGCAAFATFIAALISLYAPAWPTAFTVSAPTPGCIGRSVLDIQPFREANRYAHATSAVILRDGRLRAIWYEGTKELSQDVRLWTATYDSTRWSGTHPILGPAETSEGIGRYVRKLGDPIIFRDAKGELVIVFASLGIGGWDGASLKITRSFDEGETWSLPRNLTTAAIFNLGTNVRGPAGPAAGGFTLIPTSHEFWRQFSELVLLDSRGRVVGKRRIGIRFRGTQPFVTVLDEHRAVAFMRVDEGFTLIAQTNDAGWSWTEPTQTTSPSMDSPVVVTRIGDDLLMISSYHDLSMHRWSLNFAISTNEGQSWRTIYSRQFGTGSLTKARYPWLIVGTDGLYHLLFTYSHDDGSTELMHARISRDWIAEQGGSGCP
jgi:predicted neuraminidase